MNDSNQVTGIEQLFDELDAGRNPGITPTRIER